MEAVSKRHREKSPKLAVELPVEVQKKSFALKTSTLRILADYAAFLSAHHGKKVDEERVMEGLIVGLERDRAFATWQKEVRHA